MSDGHHFAVPVDGGSVEGGSVEVVWLTRAEARVLAQLSSHLTLPQIATELFVAPSTVRTHVQSIYRKLGVSSRRAAVETAMGVRISTS